MTELRDGITSLHGIHDCDFNAKSCWTMAIEKIWSFDLKKPSLRPELHEFTSKGLVTSPCTNRANLPPFYSLRGEGTGWPSCLGTQKICRTTDWKNLNKIKFVSKKWQKYGFIFVKYWAGLLIFPATTKREIRKFPLYWKI